MWLPLVALGASLLGSGVALLLLLWKKDVSWRLKGQKRPLGSLLSHYLVLRVVGWLGRRQRQRLETDTLDIRRVQEDTLLQRIHRNQNTEYGQLYRFAEIKNAEMFQRLHPLTRYDHYSEFIRRVARGEENVLIAERPSILAMTSGSSDMLLSTRATDREFFMQGIAVGLHAMFNTFPETQSLQKTAKLWYTPTWQQSEAGIPIGTNSSTHNSSRHVLNLYSTPAPAFQIPTEPETLYIHLLFALKDPTLGTLEANFASIIYYAFDALRERWQELVEDIRQGRVNPQLGIAADVREKLDSLLRPDPWRAAELGTQFEKGFQGIARRLWPDLNLVLTVDSGSNSLYGDLLKDHYCQGLPFYSPVYAATEGLIGVNLWPGSPERHYLLCPRSMFCEFIPVGSLEEQQPQTLLMDQVKEGECYELAVSNAAGLCRCRIGDVVKVVGFYNQCPIVEFRYRHSQMLNVRGEKTSEEVFYRALQRAVQLWPGAELIDYCCVESGLLGHFSGGSDPHYEVFVELKGVRNLSEDQRYKLDRCLQEDSAVYKSFRLKGSIGPMRVQLVGGGAFRELRSHMLASSSPSSSPNTFKMHRVLRRSEFAQFIQGKIIS
ncbi:GHDC protein, partial [Polyodon spathula]|nr:GH3 domain-containing protein [Polyodon spathula]MBN3275655.1 GHDC protein [Polyodon spathula]